MGDRGSGVIGSCDSTMEDEVTEFDSSSDEESLI